MGTDEQDEQAGYFEQRHLMVARQLRDRGIRDQRVLSAMEHVPRHQFVPEDMKTSAYEDGPLPIGHGQTISQPYTVAFMAEALQLKGSERVLEIGTGSGYAAAVLSLLAREVFTVERVPELAHLAAGRLNRLGCANVQVIVGDGTLGLPEKAPFDAIVVTAGAESLPVPYAKQLAEGGRIVIPIGAAPHSQAMYRFTRQGDILGQENLGQFAFVPLIGRYGWDEQRVNE